MILYLPGSASLPGSPDKLTAIYVCAARVFFVLNPFRKLIAILAYA
jgi:hypothetical protein